MIFNYNSGQMAQVVRLLLLVWEERGLNSEPMKYPTRCQRLTTAVTLKCGSWRKAAEMDAAHSWQPKGY